MLMPTLGVPAVSLREKAAVIFYGLSRAGRMAEARSLLEKYEALADKRAMQRGMVAAAYDAIGERDKAIEILRRAANDHDLWLAHHISAAPCDGLRKDPRLADVFATVSAR